MIRPGARIGHIRIEERLAEGGMGAVYVGYDEKLERQVALKAIRHDRLNPRARARLLVEARLLSQLDHPNICRIHEYLEDAAGDFLVLELIRGRTLRQVLSASGEKDRAGIDHGARLAVAEAVARALEAAHQKGIIHRDLKLDNVMVTEDGVTKVLDFGLARSETGGTNDESVSLPEDPLPDLPDTSLWMPSQADTRQGALVGTPATMSPEQARGEPATAASDAFALGLLLQELFTGRPPYEAGLSAPLLLTKVAEGDTLPVEGVGDPDLTSLIRRLKSLAPEARPTAAAAAERLAWIRGKPGRRRRRFLAAAVIAAFALGGTRYVLDLRTERHLALEARNEAHQEAERADAAARFLEELFRASDPRQARGEIPDAKELLRRGTERLGRDLRDQPLLRAQLLDTLGGIHTELGLYDEARPLLEEALAIREQLGGADDPAVADTLIRLGMLAQNSGRGDAVALFRRALAIREAALGPESPATAEALNNLGMGLASKIHFDEAEVMLRRSLALQERLWGDRDLRIAKVLHNLAGIAYFRGRVEEAEGLLRRSLTLREAALPEDHPELAGSREALALLLRKQGRLEESVQLLERLVRSTEKVYGPDHPELARTLLNLALARSERGDDAGALRSLERSLAIDERVLGTGHIDLLKTLSLLASHHRQHGRDATARALDQRILAIAASHLATEPDDLAVRASRVRALLDLGRTTEACAQVTFLAERDWKDPLFDQRCREAGTALPD